jgi:protein-L-isoaspartate(D-aspartate) O-methyltransferase
MDPSIQNHSFYAARLRMVRAQIEGRGIRDERVLDAMRRVPRHEFVPKEQGDRAYEDQPLPIGEEQTISQPYIVAAMLQHLELLASDRVLEIGTGSGYATALLSLLCAEVYSVERLAALAVSGEETLRRLGCRNVKIRIGDGREGWAMYAPFDAILVSAAAADVPSSLIDELVEGGRAIVPIGPPSSQELQLIRKVDGRSEIKILESVRFVPLI